MLSNNLMHWKKLPPLPSLTSQPHQVLASDPVPFADLQQVGVDGGRGCLGPVRLPLLVFPQPGLKQLFILEVVPSVSWASCSVAVGWGLPFL